MYKKKALSLIELLLATIILILACGVSFVLFANCLILNEFNRERTIAASHAQYVLEEIKDAEFTNVANNGTTLWDLDSAEIVSNGLEALRNEAIDTEVSGTDLLNINVTVGWEDRKGRAMSMNLETLIAEP